MRNPRLDIFKADNYSNDNNINGRNLQLLNEEQFSKSWISKYYRRPSYKIDNGIVYLSGLVDNVFGKGKISSIMGDLAKGIKSFKKGLSDDTSLKNDEGNNSDDSNSEKK